MKKFHEVGQVRDNTILVGFLVKDDVPEVNGEVYFMDLPHFTSHVHSGSIQHFVPDEDTGYKIEYTEEEREACAKSTGVYPYMRDLYQYLNTDMCFQYKPLMQALNGGKPYLYVVNVLSNTIVSCVCIGGIKEMQNILKVENTKISVGERIIAGICSKAASKTWSDRFGTLMINATVMDLLAHHKRAYIDCSGIYQTMRLSECYRKKMRDDREALVANEKKARHLLKVYNELPSWTDAKEYERRWQTK